MTEQVAAKAKSEAAFSGSKTFLAGSSAVLVSLAMILEALATGGVEGLGDLAQPLLPGILGLIGIFLRLALKKMEKKIEGWMASNEGAPQKGD